MERQSTTTVTSSLGNPTAAGAATYFDIANANPALTGHLTSALHSSPRVSNDALTLNNNASLFPHKDLHRTAAGTDSLVSASAFLTLLAKNAWADMHNGLYHYYCLIQQ